VPSNSAQAILHLFGDTRYRLWVNGRVAAYGPARFLPSHPEYDTVDLRPYLQPGANELRVEVNAFGASSFESLPSVGGFIAWGQLGNERLDTPDGWTAARVSAWDAWAPAHSFAQGPVEVYDANADNDLNAGPPIEHLRPDNWGPLRPRSIPMLDLACHPLHLIQHSQVANHGQTRIGFRVDDECLPVGGRSPRLLYATHLYSPIAQDSELGLFWGPHYLNGELLVGTDDDQRGNRQNAPAHLRAGWNLLYGEPEALLSAWGMLIELPEGVIARSQARHDDEFALSWAGPFGAAELSVLRSEVPRSAETLPRLPGGWKEVTVGQSIPLPARQMGWDRLMPTPETPRPLPIVVPAGQTSALVFDYLEEFIGHVRLDVEGPAGTILDVAVDEVQREDGRVHLYRAQFNVDAADRYTTADGRQTIEAFRPRGGRYVQVTVRAPITGSVTVHQAELRRTLAHPPRDGSFTGSDGVLNWAWEAGAHTTEASTEDAFVDPWRERGVYVGDALVEQAAAWTLSADDRIARRCIQQWGEGAWPDGQIRDVVPAWLDRPLLDYTLIWVLMVRDFWAQTGDIEVLETQIDAVRAAMCSSAWVEGTSGLWTGDHGHIFADWAANRHTRIGENGLLNAFRVAALGAVAEIEDALGHIAQAQSAREEVARVRQIFQTLWDPTRGQYAACRVDNQLSAAPALHANVLALAYGITTETTELPTLNYVRRQLGRCHDLDEPDRIELYFLYYALRALYDRGLAQDAEDLMRNMYRPMKEAGAWSLWETLSRGRIATGSHCHGWACSPNVYLTREALGIHVATPGHPNDLVFSPVVETLTRAEGVVPHRLGLIHAAWRVEGETLRYRVVAPAGVTVTPVPRGRLAKLIWEQEA